MYQQQPTYPPPATTQQPAYSSPPVPTLHGARQPLTAPAPLTGSAPLAESGGTGIDDLMRQGAALAESGAWSQAADVYGEATRISPSSAQARFQLGRAHAALGDKTSAMQDYNILMIQDPQLARVLFSIVQGQPA
jgi:hypothetical protein